MSEPQSKKRRHRPRVIPVLLLKGTQLYKTVNFRRPKYVGDPRNAVKLFNDKYADEIVVLDISASRDGRAPNFELIEEIAGEAFMPLAYGGGISDLETARRVLALGSEKMILNTHAIANPDLVTKCAGMAGSSSVVASIDVGSGLFGGRQVRALGGKRKIKTDPVMLAKNMVEAGAGEILINSIDRDGTFAGYDLDLVRDVSHAVDVPVIACGGCGSLEDIKAAIDAGASAAAAGSFFVFQRPHRAVLVTFPDEQKLNRLFA